MIKLGDMKQPLLPGKNLDNSSKGKNALYSALINISPLRNSHNALDQVNGRLPIFLVGSRDRYDTLPVLVLNLDRCIRIALHTLDDLSARSDNSTDKLRIDGDLREPGRMRRQIGPPFGDRFVHDIENVMPRVPRLLQGLPKHVPGKSRNLDVHLTGRNTVARTRQLEVHIPKMIFRAEDIG